MAFVPAPFGATRVRRGASPALSSRPQILMGKKRSRRSAKQPESFGANAAPQPAEPAFPAATPVEPETDEQSSKSTLRPDVPESVQYAPEVDLPVVDESRLRLPDAPGVAQRDGVRRRRRRKASEVGDEEGMGEGDGRVGNQGGGIGNMFGLGKVMSGSVVPGVEDDRAAVDAVRKLTAEFRSGNADASDLLLREIEKDPDFLFQTGNATDEYDLTSALIGTGKPNKQGVYVSPYLQSGHVLLLVIILLCAFVYYPGFPLTELDVETTDWLKRGLALTYVFNTGLAVVAYGEAKKRSQPPLFWAMKTAFLGGLAFLELRTNAPTEEERKKRAASRSKGKKGKKTAAT